MGPNSQIPIDAISWKEAPQHVGEVVTLYGPVMETDYAIESDGQPTFIDIGAAYPNAKRVTIVIWGDTRKLFPDAPEVIYSGQTLLVTGEVYQYGDVCNIEVTTPSQIQVL